MDFVDDGGQGGAFMDPWKEWEMSLKGWLVHLCDLIGYCGGICGFVTHEFMLRGVTTSSMSIGMFST